MSSGQKQFSTSKGIYKKYMFYPLFFFFCSWLIVLIKEKDFINCALISEIKCSAAKNLSFDKKQFSTAIKENIFQWQHFHHLGNKSLWKQSAPHLMRGFFNGLSSAVDDPFSIEKVTHRLGAISFSCKKKNRHQEELSCFFSSYNVYDFSSFQ